MIDQEKRRASWRRYNTSAKGQDRAWRYGQSSLYAEAKRRYVQSAKGQDAASRYEHENIGRQASRPFRRSRAAREREQTKRKRKAWEAAADNPNLTETRRNTAWRKLTGI